PLRPAVHPGLEGEDHERAPLSSEHATPGRPGRARADLPPRHRETPRRPLPHRGLLRLGPPSLAPGRRRGRSAREPRRARLARAGTLRRRRRRARPAGRNRLSAWLVYDSRRRAADAAFEAEKAAAAAVEKTDGALTRAAAATEEGKTSLARGDPFVARVRIDEAFKAIEDGRAALPSVPTTARPALEAKLAGAARAARKVRVEARLASRDARATSRDVEPLAASEARAA